MVCVCVCFFYTNRIANSENPVFVMVHVKHTSKIFPPFSLQRLFSIQHNTCIVYSVLRVIPTKNIVKHIYDE